MNKVNNNCFIYLENGSEIPAKSIGSDVAVSGEFVFNTGMSGYVETITDPSYCGQIIIFTYPQIGNYGVPEFDNYDNYGVLNDFESKKIQCKAIIVSEISKKFSHHNAKKSIIEWFSKQGVPILENVDTRFLTQMIRENGTMLGKISDKNNNVCKKQENPDNLNLVKNVSIKNPKKYGKKNKKTILAYDLGIKENILRELLKRDLEVIRVPWDFDFRKEEDNFDAIFISNGPSNPQNAKKTIEIIKEAMKKEIKIFGICLGSQILGIAGGMNTFKLKYGHRGQNQPCMDLFTKKCIITSQNHGFAIDSKTVENDFEIWFENINDGSCEGIRHKKKPFFAVQFHPEASAGPIDANYIFDEFVEIL